MCVRACVQLCDTHTPQQRRSLGQIWAVVPEKRSVTRRLFAVLARICTNAQQYSTNMATKANHILHLPDLPDVETVALTDQDDPGLCVMQIR